MRKGSCDYNGTQCNGRGNCELQSYKDGTPTFACSCDSGWNGTTCETVVNASCVVGAGNCGSHGTCVDGSCSCEGGYSGEQCQISPSCKPSDAASLVIYLSFLTLSTAPISLFLRQHER